MKSFKAILTLVSLLFSIAAAQPMGAAQLGRPISVFDLRFRVAPANLVLEQPMQFRALSIFVSAIYNHLIVRSETGLLYNGSRPLFRQAGDPIEQGVSIAAITVATAVRVSGEPTAEAIAEIARGLFLDIPIRAEDVADDNPDRDNLLLGFKIAEDVLIDFADDGMNEFGTNDGSTANLLPFEDITGYKSINTPEKIHDLRRWTPLIENLRPTSSFGSYTQQRFLAPQAALVDTIQLTERFARSLRLPTPYEDPIGRDATCDPSKLRQQTRQTRRICRETRANIRGVARLTDDEKRHIAYYDNLGRLGMLIRLVVVNSNFTPTDASIYVYLADTGMYETMLLVWRELRRHDAVRPVTLIQQLYKDVEIESADGPILGQDFASYVRTPPYPEYPSLHAAMCQFFADVSEMALGTSSVVIDDVLFNGTAVGAAPFSTGDFPVRDISIRDLQTDLADTCSKGRILAGTDLPESVELGRRIGRRIAREYPERLACIAPENNILPPCRR